MKNLTTLGLAITALTACNGGGGGGGGGGGADGLDDPTAGLEGVSDCDGVEDSTGTFQEVTGATRYYAGVFDLTESETNEGEWDVSGSETLVLIANQAWLDSDDENAMDCNIVWSVFGTATGTESNYSIAASARLDEAATTCNIPFAKEAYDESQELEYGVTVDTTGDPWLSYITFPSGAALGEGQANAGGVTYTSSAGCQFY